MAFISIKKAFLNLPFFYTKKTEKDIENVLKTQFSFLFSIPLSVTHHHVSFFPQSSLEAQKLLWYRQEITIFLAGKGIKKQVKIIQ